MLFDQPATVAANISLAYGIVAHTTPHWTAQPPYKWNQYVNARAQCFVELAEALYDIGCFFRNNPTWNTTPSACCCDLCAAYLSTVLAIYNTSLQSYWAEFCAAESWDQQVC